MYPCDSFKMVTLNVLVAVALFNVIVAVKRTTALSSFDLGLVTLPSFDKISGFSEDHVIVVPFKPDFGKFKSYVTL